MSMLAEHKSRPSWVLNPRASDWSKDQNKLGQKMLEKMGWSAGKGLGAKEQGPVEAVRVAFKGDVRGLGASRKKEQEYWLQQQESFQSLLQNLNGGDQQNVEVKSLEERSKTSKTRVHYHKFTRGKDISRYSKKDLSCIVGSGVAAPKVIPASVVSNSEQLPADDLQSRIGDDIIENSDCGAASALDSKQHSTTEMRLRSERKRNSGETVPAIESPIPAKKKKSKKSSGDNDGVLKVKPSNSTVLTPSKPPKSSGNLVADRETNVINESQKQPKRKSARSSKEVENPPIEQITSVDAEEEVLGSSKKSRIGMKSKKDALHDADDNRIVAVKEGKKKNKAGNPLRDSVAEENVIETEPKKKGRKKKKKELINVDTEGCAVESKPSRRKSKRKMVLELGGKGQEETEEIQSSLADDAKTRKEKKKKKNKAKSSEVLVDTEDLLVSESQETVVSSNILQENEDNETELGSINSQSSLVNELLGVRIHNSVDLSSRPESWFKNHILSPDSEDEISSNEESMTGIPKKKKI